jgi:hypothetical protein
MSEHIKCLVYGCENHKDEGLFVGDLCYPCHKMLTTGVVEQQGSTFIHDMRDEIEKAMHEERA